MTAWQWVGVGAAALLFFWGVGAYNRLMALRNAIGASSNEIDRLTAEREAYDKASLVRGVVVMGVGTLLLVTLLTIVLALL